MLLIERFVYIWPTVNPVLNVYSKRRAKIGFQDRLSIYAGQKYCRMLPLEHSSILLTLIKLPYVNKIFVLSISEWPLKTVLLYCISKFYYYTIHIVITRALIRLCGCAGWSEPLLFLKPPNCSPYEKFHISVCHIRIIL